MDEAVQLILAAVAAVGGGGVVKFIDWMIVRRRGSVTLTLNDRTELKSFIDDSRDRQSKTEGRLDEALRRIDSLTAKNTELLTKVAILETEERTWNIERSEMKGQLDHARMDMASLQRLIESQAMEIDDLKAKVKRLSPSPAN